MCNGRVASPTESDEIAFLCTLCAVISNHPHLINIFYKQQVSRNPDYCREVNEALNSTLKKGYIICLILLLLN